MEVAVDPVFFLHVACQEALSAVADKETVVKSPGLVPEIFWWVLRLVESHDPFILKTFKDPMALWSQWNVEISYKKTMVSFRGV